MSEARRVTPVLTQSGAQFVTPLSIAALARSKVFTELFDLTEEAQMGHIELSRAADLVLVAPATAQIMAKMAQGMADDLATTLLLATDTPVMIVPLDECAYVAAPRDAAQFEAVARGWGADHWPQ